MDAPAAASSRTFTRWTSALCAACASVALASAAVPADADGFRLESPAAGVYVHYGQQAEITSDNGGDIANAGFVVGTRCVAVIDTGGSYAVGQALRRAIRDTTVVPVFSI